MSILDNFDHPEKKQNKEHFRHLIEVALADGIIEDQEMKLLHRMGKNLGLTQEEIDNLINSTKNSSYNPPYELKDRFEQMYTIIKMVLADGKIENNEIRLATNLGLKSGFTETEIPILLSVLIDGIKNEEDDEELFKIYRKKLKSA